MGLGARRPLTPAWTPTGFSECHAMVPSNFPRALSPFVRPYSRPLSHSLRRDTADVMLETIITSSPYSTIKYPRMHRDALDVPNALTHLAIKVPKLALRMLSSFQQTFTFHYSIDRLGVGTQQLRLLSRPMSTVDYL